MIAVVHRTFHLQSKKIIMQYSNKKFSFSCFSYRVKDSLYNKIKLEPYSKRRITFFKPMTKYPPITMNKENRKKNCLLPVSYDFTECFMPDQLYTAHI